MKKFVLRFALPSVLGACVFALLCVSSIGWALPRPSAEREVTNYGRKKIV